MVNPRALASMIGSIGPSAPLIREAARNVPTPMSTINKLGELDAAFDKRVDELKPGARVAYDLSTPTPKGETFMDRVATVIDNPTAYAGSSAPGKTPSIGINPNADRAMFAHELGHLASQQTDLGQLAANIRHNPALKNALMGAVLTLPGITAALQPGDEDMDEALAVAALASAPAMIDEALATKNGLAMMNQAGIRATLGQRGKLAGGLLSYMAAPVIAAVGGNIVGNQFDENTGEVPM